VGSPARLSASLTGAQRERVVRVRDASATSQRAKPSCALKIGSSDALGQARATPSIASSTVGGNPVDSHRDLRIRYTEPASPPAGVTNLDQYGDP
jgi:hypothetical protein